MSSTYAHKAQTLGNGNAGDRGNDVVSDAGASASEEKQVKPDGEKERPSEESSLRPRPSRKPSPPLSDAELAAKQEGEAVAEYDELPAAVQLERADW